MELCLLSLPQNAILESLRDDGAVRERHYWSWQCSGERPCSNPSYGMVVVGAISMRSRLPEVSKFMYKVSILNRGLILLEAA